MKNYYDILGIDAASSPEQIREAYKKLSVKMHPDKNEGDTYFTELFKNINEANQVLTNPLRKHEYDSSLKQFYVSGRRTANFNRASPNVFRPMVQKKPVWKWVVGSVVAVLLLAVVVTAIFDNDDSTTAVASVPTSVEVIQLLNSDSAIGNHAAAEPPAATTEPIFPVKADDNLLDLLNKEGASAAENAGAKTDAASTLSVSYASVKSVSNVQPSLTIQVKPVKEATSKPAAPATTATVTLSNHQMQDLLQQVNNEKENATEVINCVKILQSSGSNVENGFDLAGFFSRNGYVISGRETIASPLQGIHVRTLGKCIVVTVGVL